MATEAIKLEPPITPNSLRFEIEAVIRKNNAGSARNIPDELLAEFIIDCLVAFDKAAAVLAKRYDSKPDISV